MALFSRYAEIKECILKTFVAYNRHRIMSVYCRESGPQEVRERELDTGHYSGLAGWAAAEGHLVSKARMRVGVFSFCCLLYRKECHFCLDSWFICCQSLL